MATAYPLPDQKKVEEILGLLFDGLEVKPGGSFDQTPAGGAWFGVFVSDGGDTVALCGADANLAASMGAALSMLPPNIAKEAAKAKKLTDVMEENIREVMNICTRLVMESGAAHLRLDKCFETRSLPQPAAKMLGGAAGRREFQLQLPKYGGGVLSLIST
jgi:hypothetical protein